MTTQSKTSTAQIRRFAVAVILGLAAVTAAKAEEGTSSQRMACAPDAWRLCSDHIPDIPAIRACMISKQDELSAACRSTFKPGVLRSARR